MKFCKKYEEYMQGQKEKKNLPGVGFKKLKKILKKCRRDTRMDFNEPINHQHDKSNCPHECPGIVRQNSPEKINSFFLGLRINHLKILPLQFVMEDVVGWFNENAQKLLELHLASGFKKCLTWLKGNKKQRNHLGLIQEGKDLVNYALINAIAIRKILKKYDKASKSKPIFVYMEDPKAYDLMNIFESFVLQIHESRQGQAFKTQVQKMRIEILQSPWLCELMAFHINLKETKKESGAVVVAPSSFPALFDGCSLMFDDGKPLLSCELSDSVKVDIDLTCSICLVSKLKMTSSEI